MVLLDRESFSDRYCIIRLRKVIMSYQRRIFIQHHFKLPGSMWYQVFALLSNYSQNRKEILNVSVLISIKSHCTPHVLLPKGHRTHYHHKCRQAICLHKRDKAMCRLLRHNALLDQSFLFPVGEGSIKSASPGPGEGR